MSQVSEKLSENSEMSDVAVAGQMLREGWPMGSVGERIRNAATVLRWSYNRTRDVWYEQARRIDAHEMARLRSTADRIGRREHEAERRAHDAREELDRALALVASHLAAEAAQGDRDAASALRKIVGAMDMA